MSAAVVGDTAAIYRTATGCVAATGVAAAGIAAIGIAAIEIFVSETAAVKPAAVEIAGIPSFKKRAIVRIVVIIAVVAVPGRVVVKGISVGIIIGDLIFGVWLLVDGGWRLVYYGRGRNVYARSAKRKPDAGVDIDLGGTGVGDQQAGGCEYTEGKELFHFMCFKLAWSVFVLLQYIRRAARLDI
jgi:hypothetical protein